MLKWIWIGAGVLLALLVVTVVAGYSLPQDHIAARAIELHQKPDAVFALITDFKDEPSWRPEVQQVDLVPDADGHAGFREDGENGVLTFAVLESTPPSRLVTRIIDKDLPFGGSWIFEISPEDKGCRLNITEQGEIYNPIYRVVSRYFLGYSRTIDAYLQNVSKKFGDSAVPEAGTPAVR